MQVAKDEKIVGQVGLAQDPLDKDLYCLAREQTGHAQAGCVFPSPETPIQLLMCLQQHTQEFWEEIPGGRGRPLESPPLISLPSTITLTCTAVLQNLRLLRLISGRETLTASILIGQVISDLLSAASQERAAQQRAVSLCRMQGNHKVGGLSFAVNTSMHSSASLAYSPDPHWLSILKNHNAVIHDAPHAILISHPARPARAIRTCKAGEGGNLASSPFLMLLEPPG